MRPAEIRVVVVAPEGRDLEGFVVAPDRHGPESILIDGPGEELGDPLRAGVCGQVPVVGLTSDEQVPERPADQVGGLSAGPEDLDDLEDRSRDGPDRPAWNPFGPGQFRPRNR